jgi:fructose-specific component phosphotransferase system IIB-like protein
VRWRRASGLRLWGRLRLWASAAATNKSEENKIKREKEGKKSSVLGSHLFLKKTLVGKKVYT